MDGAIYKNLIRTISKSNVHQVADVKLAILQVNFKRLHEVALKKLQFRKETSEIFTKI